MNGTPPQAVPPRSGDQVLNTMSRVGLVATLLSPFIAAGLTWIDTHTIITFNEGYQSQLETAVGLGVMYAVAALHMRSIRRHDVAVAEVPAKEPKGDQD